MVEVVVPLAKSDNSSDEMVPRCQPVVKRRLSKPMRQGIHAEDALHSKGYIITCQPYSHVATALKVRNMMDDRQS